jgi:hypothetical protein
MTKSGNGARARRDSQMPTSPAVDLAECLAALDQAGATLPRPESGFRLARAPSAPLLVSSVDVPYLLVSRIDLEWFALEEAAARLVLRVDGRTSVEDIAESAGVPFDRACSVLGELAEREVIAFH